MLRNYWKLALRNLQRNRGFAAVNIFGLALGMGSFLLICLHLTDEWSYDRFHEHSGATYRVFEEVTEGDDAGKTLVPVNFRLGFTAPDAIPEIDISTALMGYGRGTLQHEETYAHEPIIFANSSFFEVFSFPLTDGNPETVLDRTNTIVVSEAAAKRYFGTTQVIGEVLEAYGQIELEITGVMEDFPSNSHLNFDFLISAETFRTMRPELTSFIESDFDTNYLTTYFRLNASADPEAVSQKITDWVMENRVDSTSVASTFHLQPISDIHLHSEGMEESFHEKPGNPRYLWVFSLVALFILIIASINYTNLATALATRRAREVGMRKVLGSRRKQLVFQFLLESLMLASVALIIGFSLVQLALPMYNQWSGKTLSFSLLELETYLILGSVVILVALLSGSYPAFFLSRFSPVMVLKGAEKAAHRRFGLREVLVMVQFGISGLLVMATAIMFQQLRYLDTKDLGFTKDQQLIVDINSAVARNQFETMKDAFSSLSSVQAVSVTNRVPGEWKNIPMADVQDPNAPEESLEMIFLCADEDFLETYDIELLSGRNFAPGMGDSATVLLNESAAKLLGIEGSEEAEVIMNSVAFGANRRQRGQYRTRVLGVVQDFHFEDLHQSLKPVVISFWSNPYHVIDYYTLRVNANDPQRVVADVKAAYETVDPGSPIEYHFLNDQWEAKYRNDTRNGQLIGLFAGLGMLIACLGLFALASLTIQRRLKEVAIRKVLGSSRNRLVRLLSYDFLRLVVFSLAVALPLAWIITNTWLETFAYRTHVSVPLLVGLFISIVLLAFVTVSARTYRAASQNPVKALRNE